MQRTVLPERVRGALWGLSLGDAYGMPMEMWPRAQREAVFGKVTGLLPGHPENSISKGRTAGETTDDTAFTRLISELLIEQGTVEPEKLVQRIQQWLAQGGEKCDLVLGPSTRKAIEDIANGADAAEAGKGGRTNGAAMRILPVGIVFDTADEEGFVAEIVSACMATHYTNLAIGAAGAVAAAVSCAVRGGSCGEAVAAAIRMAERCEREGHRVSEVSIAERIGAAVSIADGCADDETLMTRLSEQIGTGLPAEESIPTAIAIFHYTNGDPMHSARLCANIGGDTDTMGAIACGLAGAISGTAAMDGGDLDRIRRASGIDWNPCASALTMRAAGIQQESLSE